MTQRDPGSIQRAFADALVDPARSVPAGLKVGAGVDLERRYQVHRDNAVDGSVDALASRFPVCLRLVGEDFFTAMAGEFVRGAPPRSPILSQYGEGFAAFIETFAPAATVPYLADVARLEHAIGSSYHAADATPLAIDALGRVPQPSLGALVFRLHPAVRLVSSRYAIVSIWRTNAHQQVVATVDAGCAEDALVARPETRVQVRALQPGGFGFLTALAGGKSLAESVDAAMQENARFDLTANLRETFEAGAIGAIE